MRIVESGDYKPTAGSYKIFDELKAKLAVEINKLNIDINERQTKLEQSKRDIFVSCIVLCLVGALILLEWWYKLH